MGQNWLSEAIDDIRQKVFEEPWFGREVTDKAAEHDHETEPLPTKDREQADAAELDRAPDLEVEHEAEHDIER